MKWLALALGLTLLIAGPAMGAELDWLPYPVQAQLLGVSEKPSDQAQADLYLCHPFCELVGEFRSRTEFLARPGQSGVATLSEAKKPENQSYLRLIPSPLNVIQPELLVQNHLPEPVNPQPQPLNAPSASAVAANQSGDGSSNGPAGNPVDAGAQPPTQAPAQDQEQQILLGWHLDTLLGARSSTTSANTDTGSDFESHPIVGGGLDFEAPGLTTIGSGNVGAIFDLSFWDELSPKSSSDDDESWSSQTARVLLGALWQKPASPWRLGLLIEGRDETDVANPNTAIAFSSTYLWASVGAHLQYRKTTLEVFRSLYGVVQDSDQYRGTSVTSTRTMLELNSCLSLAAILGGEFDICGDAQLSWIGVTGTGTPAQPVFTTSPTYDYNGWQGGIQFKVLGISL